MVLTSFKTIYHLTSLKIIGFFQNHLSVDLYEDHWVLCRPFIGWILSSPFGMHFTTKNTTFSVWSLSSSKGFLYERPVKHVRNNWGFSCSSSLINQADCLTTGFPRFVAHQNRSPWAFIIGEYPQKEAHGLKFLFSSGALITLAQCFLTKLIHFFKHFSPIWHYFKKNMHMSNNLMYLLELLS